MELDPNALSSDEEPEAEESLPAGEENEEHSEGSAQDPVDPFREYCQTSVV